MKNKSIIIVFMFAFFINAVAQHKVVKRTSTQNKGAYAIKKMMIHSTIIIKSKIYLYGKQIYTYGIYLQ